MRRLAIAAAWVESLGDEKAAFRPRQKYTALRGSPSSSGVGIVGLGLASDSGPAGSDTLDTLEPLQGVGACETRFRSRSAKKF